MSEEKDQQNLYQNQTSWNWWSDLIKEDWWLLNWNATSEEWKENSKKRFDLLWSTYEDSIRNGNLDWNKNDKNLPKTYPWKKWRNAWAIVLIVDLVLSMLWLFSFILELISTILMVIFLILWIKTIRTPENQEIIKENNIWKRLKWVIWIYAALTAIYFFFDVATAVYMYNSIKEGKNFDDRVKVEYSNLYDNEKFRDDVYWVEFDKIWNNAFWCDCYWDNATESIWLIDQLTSRKKVKQIYTVLKATVQKNIENWEWTY